MPDEVDQDAVVATSLARHAVPAAADRQRQAALAGEVDRVDHVRDARAAGDQRGPLVDHARCRSRARRRSRRHRACTAAPANAPSNSIPAAVVALSMAHLAPPSGPAQQSVWGTPSTDLSTLVRYRQPDSLPTGQPKSARDRRPPGRPLELTCSERPGRGSKTRCFNTSGKKGFKRIVARDVLSSCHIAGPIGVEAPAQALQQPNARRPRSGLQVLVLIRKRRGSSATAGTGSGPQAPLPYGRVMISSQWPSGPSQ